MSCINRIGESAKTAFKEAVEDIKTMTHKYPLVAVISAIIFAILGIMQVSALTISAFLSAAILLSMAGAIGYAIFQDPGKFFEEIKKSLDFFSDKEPNQPEGGSNANDPGSSIQIVHQNL